MEYHRSKILEVDDDAMMVDVVRSTLENIALAACHYPLINGDVSTQDPNDRFRKISRYLNEEIFGIGEGIKPYWVVKEISSDAQTVPRIIGAGYVWDGWIERGNIYVRPQVELAFIHPEFDHEKGVVAVEFEKARQQLDRSDLWGY